VYNTYRIQLQYINNIRQYLIDVRKIIKNILTNRYNYTDFNFLYIPPKTNDLLPTNNTKLSSPQDKLPSKRFPSQDKVPPIKLPPIQLPSTKFPPINKGK